MANQPNLEDGAVVIFGVTGDLTRRKLIPAIYELFLAKRIPASLWIIGFARREWDDEYLRGVFFDSIKDAGYEINRDKFDKMFLNIKYVESNFDDGQGFSDLLKFLSEKKIKNILYYLATPPDAYDVIIKNLGKAELNKSDDGWTRIVVEKPYGRDLESAKSWKHSFTKFFLKIRYIESIII